MHISLNLSLRPSVAFAFSLAFLPLFLLAGDINGDGIVLRLALFDYVELDFDFDVFV